MAAIQHICRVPSPRKIETHFLNIPRNILSLLVSSGGLSAACVAAPESSLAVDGAVDAGLSSKEPELVDAIV